MHPVSEVSGMLSQPQLDPLTGLLTRPALLATLFRETDRVQRSKHPLSLAQFSIDDFEHWTARLTKLQCDALLKSVAERVGRLLRSYDTFGRTGDHEFLLILPGCSAINSEPACRAAACRSFFDARRRGWGVAATLGVLWHRLQ
jgi:diguanylate cyclase (GGDEF)-like protein